MGRYANLRIKDITKGGIYAVRRAIFIDSTDGRRLERDEIAAMALADQMALDRAVEPGTVVARHRDEGRWTVRFADGTTEQVRQPDLLGRWDDHLSDVDLDAAADRLRDVAIDLGWVEADHDLGPLAAGTLFGGPVGITAHGTVELRLTAEQAHQVADLLRDAQARREAR